MNNVIQNPYKDDTQSRESLITNHMDLVKRVALHLKARLSPFMDLNELIPVSYTHLPLPTSPYV